MLLSSISFYLEQKLFIVFCSLEHSQPGLKVFCFTTAPSPRLLAHRAIKSIQTPLIPKSGNCICPPSYCCTCSLRCFMPAHKKAAASGAFLLRQPLSPEQLSCRSEQLLGVLVTLLAQQLSAGETIHDSAFFHHDKAVAHNAYSRNIMRDEEVCHTKLTL